PAGGRHEIHETAIVAIGFGVRNETRRRRSLVPTFLEMVMQQCPNCWEPMSITANLCPHCGYGKPIATQPSKRWLGYLFWLSFLLMLAFAVLLVRYLEVRR